MIRDFDWLCGFWRASESRYEDGCYEADIACPLCEVRSAVIWLHTDDAESGVRIRCNPRGVHPQDGCPDSALYRLRDSALAKRRRVKVEWTPEAIAGLNSMVSGLGIGRGI